MVYHQLLFQIKIQGLLRGFGRLCKKLWIHN